MKPQIIVFNSILVMTALAGCANSPPADPDLAKTIVPVQTHQMKDINMTCDELSGEIKDTESEVAALDKQINYQKQQSNTYSMISALSGLQATTATTAATANLANTNATLGNINAGMAGQQAMSKTELRMNINQRHDALMAVYFARNCKSG
jgi:outer membrane murein-binding lipoprotein Lpp